MNSGTIQTHNTAYTQAKKIHHGTRGDRSAQGDRGSVVFVKGKQSEEQHSDAHLAMQE